MSSRDRLGKDEGEVPHGTKSEDYVLEFSAVLRANGIEPHDGMIIADGLLHRYRVAGDKSGKNGAYKLHLDDRPAGWAKCWKRGTAVVWHARGDFASPSARDLQERRRRRELATQEKQRRHNAARKRAQRDWARAKRANPQHSYLTRKGLPPLGLRQLGANLLVALQDTQGVIHSHERIARDGRKFYLKHGAKQGNFALVAGILKDRALIQVAEGWATGATMHLATSAATVAAADAGNLLHVVKALRKKYPKSPILVGGDHDEVVTAQGPMFGKRPGHEAANAAASAVTNAFAAIPKLPDGRNKADWDDIRLQFGLEVVRQELQRAAGSLFPTYLDRSVPIEAGRRQLTTLMRQFFSEIVPAHVDALRSFREELANNPNATEPMAPGWLINVTTGTGKSGAAILEASRSIEMLQARGEKGTVAFFAQQHNLTADLARRCEHNTGRAVAVWRGLKQLDPELQAREPGSRMCLEPELSAAAVRAYVPLEKVCKICPKREQCGYRRQRLQQAHFWFFAHEMLFRSKPAAISAPFVRIIDETFVKSGVYGFGPDEPCNLRLSDLELEPADLIGPDRDVVIAGRRMLKRALDRCAGGALSRQLLLSEGFTPELARDCAKVEWSRRPLRWKPEGTLVQIRAELRKLASVFSPRLPQAFSMIAQALEKDVDAIPGLTLVRDHPMRGGGTADVLNFKWRGEPSTKWGNTPVLLLDATGRPELIKSFFPHVQVKPAVELETPHQRVTQIVDRFPQSMFVAGKASSLTERYVNARRNNLRRLLNFIELMAYKHRDKGIGPWDVLVIAQKAVEAALLPLGMPDRVSTTHFNAFSGLDHWGGVACVVQIGSLLPSVTECEDQAEIVCGRTVARQGDDHWQYESAWIRMGDGSTTEVKNPRHADPLVEAVRWSICEGTSLQGIGRVRGVNRGPANPVEVILLSDIALPLTVTQIGTWARGENSLLTRFAIAFVRGGGVLPLSKSELAGLYPDLWPSPDAVRSDLRKLRGVKCLVESILDNRPPLVRVKYRRPGIPGTAFAAVIDSLLPDPKGTLEALVGPLSEYSVSVDDEAGR